MTDPHLMIVRSALALACFLMAAQCAIALISWRNPHKDLTEVRIRTRSWWFIFLSLELAIYFGKGTALLYFACVSFFGLREYLSRVPTRICDRNVLFWVFLAIPIQFLLIYSENFLAFALFVPIYGICVIATRMLLTGQPKGFTAALGVFQLGLLSTVYSLGFVAYLLLLRPAESQGIVVGSMLFLVCMTEFNDVFQFVSGKLFGRRKIMPLISPKKTVEGLLGGTLLCALLSAFAAPLLTPLSPWEGLAAGAALSVLGFLGDVLMSAIKRDLEIKDFSQLIPGHGGVLDRIDSLVISAPLYFCFLWALTAKGTLS